MRTIKGPAIFLAQFAGDRAPFNALDSMAAWAANLGYKGVQIPTWDSRLFDLEKAAKSKTYCDDLKGTLAKHAIVPTELSTHLQGQLVAVHPAYDLAFDSFAPQGLRRKPRSRQEWAASQLKLAAAASANLGLSAHATFSGALAWPYLYPWPQRPVGLVEAAFDELANRWRPILDAFDEAGVDLAYEIHPGEDLHDGTSFEMFLDRVGNHRGAIFYSTRAILSFSSSTISLTSTSIRPASKPSTSRTRNLIRPDDRASMEVSSLGLIALVDFALPATGR